MNFSKNIKKLSALIVFKLAHKRPVLVDGQSADNEFTLNEKATKCIEILSMCIAY